MRRTLVLLLVVAVIAVGAIFWSRHNKGTTPTTLASTTTTVPPVAPLTGLPDPAGQALTRPALTVKVENTPEALPQWGIDRADVVYEEIVNGGITRLAAIFNSQAPAKVGPVRSVRPTDTFVVWPLGGIFAYSGGAPYAVESISKAPVKLVDETSAGAAMYRDPNRQAPSNLYASAGALFQLKGTPTPPRALFTYRHDTLGAGTTVVHHFTVEFPSIYPVTWTWNTTNLSWDRTLFGQPIVTGTGVRVSPKNVVVMFVNYFNGVGAFTSYTNLLGTGQVEVFSDGHMVRGTWSRAAKTDVVHYHTVGGKVLAMEPGQTWVELLNIGARVPIS
ncbi:MAG TPA: DUF3048 domain-containing protein [Acidimicrobiales bacterium]|nr:DUF3048 domain-containing protein [Acidimicrobiales bacterium]